MSYLKQNKQRVMSTAYPVPIVLIEINGKIITLRNARARARELNPAGRDPPNIF